VNNLRAGALQDAAHDIDGGIVPVEERSGGDEAHFMRGLVGIDRFHNQEVGSWKSEVGNPHFFLSLPLNGFKFGYDCISHTKYKFWRVLVGQCKRDVCL
jgi:hypothetical protein